MTTTMPLVIHDSGTTKAANPPTMSYTLTSRAVTYAGTFISFGGRPAPTERVLRILDSQFDRLDPVFRRLK